MPPVTPTYFQIPSMAPVEQVQHKDRPLPKPRLRLQVHSLEDKGSQTFNETIRSPSRLLTEAIRSVLHILYPSFYRDSASAISHTPWPEVRSVTLVIDDGYDGVAYTSGIPLDDAHKEIHLSTSYVQHQVSSGRLLAEIEGVIVHEMVHCWQHSCHGVPGGLIEGIADFVRLKAGYSPPHWKKEHSGSWDGGYQHTAYFLEWLEVKFGSGSVERINLAIGGVRDKYEEKPFWKDLFDQDVQSLWEEYGNTFEQSSASQG